MQFLRRHWPVLTLVLLPLTVLWKCVFLGQTIGPWDQIMQMAPWNGPKPTSAWDVLQADGVLQFYPWRDLVFHAWGSGQMPYWNPYQLCGTPLLANSQSGGFYPLHILMGVLHVPTSLAITLLAWFHLAWAALGARFLAKGFGANEYGAVTAGACFGMSAFMVSWTPLASVITTCAWIPWVLGFGAQLLGTVSAKSKRTDQTDSTDPADGHPIPDSRPPIPTLAASIAMMLLGGHLQFAAYGFIGLFVIGLVSAFQNKPGLRAIGGLVFAVLVGGMLAAPQLVPVLTFSKTSHRQVKPTPEGAEAYAASALGLPELSGLAISGATGLPGVAISPSGSEEIIPGYWPAYVKRGASFAEGAISVGPWLLGLLFMLTRKKLKELPAPWIVASVGVLLAIGPLSTLLYFLIPGWSATGSPGRAAVLVVLSLCVAAGTMFPGSSGEKNWIRSLIGLIVSTLVLEVIGFILSFRLKPWIPGLENSQGIRAAGATTPLPFLAMVIIAGVAFQAIRQSRALAIVLGIGVTLIIGPIFCLPSGTPINGIPAPDPQDRVAFVNSNWGLLNAAKAIMPGNTATMSRIHDVGGYDSLLNKDTLEMLRTVNGGKDPAPDANGNMMFVKPEFDPTKLAEAGVTEVWSLRPLPQLTMQPEMRGGMAVYKLEGPGRAFVVQASQPANFAAATITFDGTDRQVVEATGPGTLVVKDRNMTGWTATVDGKPAVIKEGLWREVEIGEGAHIVEFRYSPPGMGFGFVLFLAGAGLLAAQLFLSKRQKPIQLDNAGL